MKRCPVDKSLSLLGKKFTLHIIRNMLLLKQNRFNQLVRSIEGINSKTLSVRLQELEAEGLITRKIISQRPIEVEYSITEKGKTIQSVLDQMASFSMKYYPKEIFKDGKPHTFQQVYHHKPSLITR